MKYDISPTRQLFQLFTNIRRFFLAGPLHAALLLSALLLSNVAAFAAGNRETCFEGTANAAVKACRSELQSNPRDKKLYEVLGRHLDRQGRYSQSVEVYRRGLMYFPGDSRLTNRFRTAEEKLGRKTPPSAPSSATKPPIAEEKAAAAETARKKKLIAEIQKRLNDIGFDAGPADGVAGKRTRDAASRFVSLIKGDSNNAELNEPLVSALDEAVRALRGAEKHLSKAQQALAHSRFEEASEALETIADTVPWSVVVNRRKDEIATQIAEAKKASGTPANLPAPQAHAVSPPSEAQVDPSLETAIAEAVNKVFSNAPGSLSASVRRALILDPVIDGVSGAESVASRSMKSQLVKLVSGSFQRFDIKDFISSEAVKAPYVLIGTFTGVNKQRKTAGVREAYRICLALLDVEWGTVAAKTKVFSQANGVDITPSAFYRDSPVWKADESIQAYINSCQATKVGDPVDPLYLARISAAALINEAIDAYENESYKESQELFKRAFQTEGGKQLRTYNGLYLTSWKLGELNQATEAFANAVEYALSSGRLGLKLPFVQGSAGLQIDPNDGGQHDMWLAQIAKEAAARGYCLEIMGHTHRAGPGQLNQRLSLRRAEYVKRRLEAEAPELTDRIIASGRGADDNLIGSGTGDSADELDRRMEFEAIDCSTSE